MIANGWTQTSSRQKGGIPPSNKSTGRGRLLFAVDLESTPLFILQFSNRIEHNDDVTNEILAHLPTSVILSMRLWEKNLGQLFWDNYLRQLFRILFIGFCLLGSNLNRIQEDDIKRIPKWLILVALWHSRTNWLTVPQNHLQKLKSFKRHGASWRES